MSLPGETKKNDVGAESQYILKPPRQFETILIRHKDGKAMAVGQHSEAEVESGPRLRPSSGTSPLKLTRRGDLSPRPAAESPSSGSAESRSARRPRLKTRMKLPTQHIPAPVATAEETTSPAVEQESSSSSSSVSSEERAAAALRLGRPLGKGGKQVAPPPLPGAAGGDAATGSVSGKAGVGAGRFRLREKQTALPDNLGIPPSNVRKSGEKPVLRGDGGRLGAAAMALLLITAANALALVPAWSEALESGVAPVPQIAFLLLTSGIMSTFLFSRSLALRFLAATFTFFLLLTTLLAIIIPAFYWEYIPEQFFSGSDLAAFAEPPYLLAGAFLLLGALVMITGYGATQWVLTLVFILFGLLAPWLPLEEILPPRPVGNVYVQFSDFTFRLNGEWRPTRFAAGMPGRKISSYSSEDGELNVMMGYAADAADTSLDQYTDSLLKYYRDRYAAVAASDVHGKLEQKRIAVFGEERIELRVVRKGNGIYVLGVSAAKALFAEREAEIKQVFSILD